MPAPPEAKPFKLATPREVMMTDEPNRPLAQPDLSQAQNPKATPQPATSISPEQVRANQQSLGGGGNLQQILAYFRSQGVPDNHVVATIAGIQLRISDLTQQPAAPPPPPPAPTPPTPSPVESDAPVHEDEFKS